MQAINLLPKDLTPKKSILKLSVAVRKTSLIGFSILLIGIIVSVGVIYMLTRQTNSSKLRQKELIDRIVSYEQTEHQLILIKDRLGKADLVLERNTAMTEIGNFDQLLLLFPEDVSIDQTTLSNEGTQINLQVGSSSSLVKLFASILSSRLYQSVRLNGFDYSYLTGYKVSLKMKT
jgi:hypothetical protein